MTAEKKLKPIAGKGHSWKSVLTLILVFLVVCVIMFVVVTIRSSRELEAELDKLRASGAPLTTEDFKAKKLRPFKSISSIERADSIYTQDIPENGADFFRKLVEEEPESA
ncbi:hypothetical protein ACFL1X_12025, partial [Candidatus Hydrogenedentota bacterium]